jgi:glycosyltransferase involved in cell wall biosynthesis
VVSRRFTFAVPGDLSTPTGGYAYDRRMIAELRAYGWHADVLDLGSDFPQPSPHTRERALAVLAAVEKGQPIVIDGLALGVLPDAAASLRQTHPLIDLVHHPLALESGLTEVEAAALQTSERAALANVRHVIVTSANTARLLTADYDVPPDRLTVALPGVDRVQNPSRRPNGPVRLLSVGSIVPRKGHDVLIAALSTLADLPWQLTIVGDARSPEAAAQLNAGIATARLQQHVQLVGAVSAERLADFYADADVFVLASRFEGYGMAFAEAVAAGLPVIGTTAGAIPEAVPAAAGLLVPPDDVAALAGALITLLKDKKERQRLSQGARAAASNLPTWQAAGQTFARVLESVA